MARQDDAPYGIARSASTVMVFAFLGPLAGLAVEITLAWSFGASGTMDAFRVASLLLVLGNQLLISQMLPSALVPLFSELRARGKPHDIFRLAFSLLGLVAGAVVPLALWIWLHPGGVVSLLAPGLERTAREEAAYLVRYFSVACLLFLGSGVMSSLLQAYRIFWVTTASQLVTNLAMLTALLVIGTQGGSAPLALGVIVGAASMFVLHLAYTFRVAKVQGVDPKGCLIAIPWHHLAKVFRLGCPLAAMIAISHWGALIINRELSAMPSGTLAEFGYAWKLLALVGILPASLVTVVFPSLSDAQARHEKSEFARLVERGLRMILLLTLPVAGVLFVLRVPLFSLLYERGSMTAEAVRAGSRLFGILLFGAPASLLLALLCKISYSVQDMKAPAAVSVISAILVTVLVPLGAKYGGAAGVMWVYGGIVWLSVLLLFLYQVQCFAFPPVLTLAKYTGSLLMLSGISAGAASVVGTLFRVLLPGIHGVNPGLDCVLMAGAAFATGLVFSRLLNIGETREILNFVRWRLTGVLSMVRQKAYA